MIATIANLILISIICVLIIDLSGFIDSLKWGLSKILTHGKIPSINYNLPPIDCSLCMTFWSGLAYLLIIGQFSIPMLAFVLFLAIMTPETKELITLFKDLILFVIYKIKDTIQDDTRTI